VKLLLEEIQYEKYNWNICGDLKVFLSCLATKCFVAFCVSGIVGRQKIISSKNSVLNENCLIPGQKNVLNTPLINREKVYLPPLHTKLGLIKNSIKAVDQNRAGCI
jgi:hypothetical protein